MEREATSRCGSKNRETTQTLRLEGTFGGHQAAAELTVKLDQALKGFLNSESLHGSGYLSS